MDYKVFKEFDIDRFVKTSDSILFTGCGNSSKNALYKLGVDITRDMYLDGYHSLCAIDYSKVVIDQLIKRDANLAGIKCTRA